MVAPVPASSISTQQGRTDPAEIKNDTHLENAIAIVGMSARLPHAPNIKEFWKLLVEGKDGIDVVPPERWNAEAFFSKDTDAPGKIPTMRAGLIQDIDKFDAQFFRISNREAECMDPQQRLILEVAYEALEDAGQTLDSLRGSDTGVFVGVCFSDYHKAQLSDVNKIKPYVQTGCAHSMVSNRISYFFDLKGPSLSVDTACSSSLVALHLASQSLLSGECTQAIVGGTSIHISPDNFVAFAKLHMLSSDGMCRAFDDRGNGYVRSEGICTLVLKRLSQAIADNDPIHAIICGTGVNQDGATPGITTPGRDTQAALIRQVYAKAALDPTETQYVEAHGTGTPVGDPIEANALGEVIGAGRTHNPCLIGSVKSNVGHLEGASGLVGVIKAVLAMQHGLIPATLHFAVPNSKIEFTKLGLQVVAKNTAWPVHQGKGAVPKRASINSFGFGGTNAHVIVEEWPLPARTQSNSAKLPRTLMMSNVSVSPAMIFPISANTKKATEQLVDRYVALISDVLSSSNEQEQKTFFWNLAYTLGCRRTHLPFRTSAVATNLAELVESLKSSKGRISRTKSTSAAAPTIAFVCTGQGAQWYAMGRQLLDLEPVFAQVMYTCDTVVKRLGGWSIIEELLRDEKKSRINSSDISQPACCALQIALIELWRSWGITPTVVLGHSSGEMAAAYACGALSLEDAMIAAFYRGKYMVQDAGKGKMAAVGLSEQEALEMLKSDGYEDTVYVAAVNSPTNVTLSGDPEPIEQICAKLTAAGVFSRVLRINCAFHSHHMVPFAKQLQHALRNLRAMRSRPGVSMISSVTKGTILDGSELTADYWVHNMCNTVRFADAISTLVNQFEPTVVIEIGNHPALQGPIRQCFLGLGTSDIPILGSISRESDERKAMLGTLSTLFSAGVSIAWQSVQECNQGVDMFAQQQSVTCLSSLPSYPWNHEERYWTEPLHSKLHRMRPTPHELLGQRQHHIMPTWCNELSVDRVPYLNDHRIQGSIVFPAAGYCEMALRAAKCIAGSSASMLVLEDVTFKRAMMFDSTSAVLHTQLVARPASDSLEFTIFATDDEDEQASSWQEFCSGRICIDAKNKENVGSQIEQHQRHAQQVDSACENGHEANRTYSWMREQGLEYGPFFQPLRRIICGNDNVAVGHLAQTVRAEEDDYRFNDRSDGGYVLHPTLLDGCFQALIGAVKNLSGSYLPVHIARLSVFNTPRNTEDLKVFVHATDVTSKQLQGDLTICNSNGEVIAHVGSLSCSSIGNKGQAAKGNNPSDVNWNEHLFDIQWRPDFDDIFSGPTAEATLNRLLSPHKHRPLQNHIERPALADINERTHNTDMLALRYVLKTLTALKSSNTQVHERYTHFIQWAEKLRALAEKANIAVSECENSDHSSSTDPEIRLVHKMGEKLPSILTGTIEPLSLMFSDSTIHEVYESGISASFSGHIIGSLSELITHKHGSLRILEIGAGTGGTTTNILNIIGDRFDSYLFTDISAAFFDKARTKFLPHVEAGRMKFSILDIEQDPLAQLGDGNSPATGFDLIFATDVLHATTDIAKTVANVRKLLAPGGMLVLSELTSPSLWIQMVFGLMPGWWLYSDPEKRDTECGGPTLSIERWTNELEQAGFDKVVAIPDCEQSPIHTVFVARTPTTTTRLDADATEITLVTDGEHETILQSSLVQLTNAAVVHPNELLAHDGSVDRRGAAIYLLELQQSALFTGCTEEMLDALRAVTLRFATVFWIVRGAIDTAPQQAPIIGLLRVLTNECPDLQSVVIDIDPASSDLDNAQRIHQIVQSTALRFIDEEPQRKESEIAIRDNKLLIPRMFHLKLKGSHQADEPKLRKLADQLAADGTICSPPILLEIGQPGLLDSLRFREVAMRTQQLGPDEIEIEIHATGLNFKDVMIAMGMLSDEATAGGYCASNLGIECAGVVVAVGSDAHELKVGDRVLAVARNSFSTRVVTLGSFAVPIPSGMTVEEAVSIPATFLTAYYALYRLARLERGETVLIHAAAGGVGQAAIQLCHLAGAEVFATCGSDAKRQFLKEQFGIPDDHILSSRNTSFAADIMRMTNGRGVDVVLNSLAGDMLKKSVDVLAPFGRFLEIGKRDIYANSKLDMKPFGENISFFAIDLDRLMGKYPRLTGQMFRELMALFEQKQLRPLPTHLFSFSKPVEAFRFMQQGRHIGKVVLVQDKSDTVQVIPTTPALFRHNKTYIIVGGMGGFGRAVVEWMAQEGARNIVLMSRSAGRTPKEEQASFVAKLQGLAHGDAVNVLFESVDVSKEQDLRRSLDALKSAPSVPPIGGVFHAAMVLDDGMFHAPLTATRFRNVLEPKVAGAWNLHNLLADVTLDFFVMFSSVSAVIGNSGQSNYAAANCFLDALAAHRRLKGLPAISINWGAIGDVGYVAEHQDLQQSMKRRGLDVLPISEALKVLEYAIRTGQQQPSQLMAAPVNWVLGSKLFPSLSGPMFVDMIRREVAISARAATQHQSGTDAGDSLSLQQRISNASAEERPQIMAECIQHKLAAMLALNHEEMDAHRPMTEFGIDSLMAVELKNWIETELKAQISVLDITGGKSVMALAAKLCSSPTAAKPPTTDSGRPQTPVATDKSMLICHNKLSDPKVRLICVPFLGGDDTNFADWPAQLQRGDQRALEVWTVRIGAGERQWDKLVERLAAELTAVVSERPVPYVMYAHSLGVLIAYETLLQMVRKHPTAPLPRNVIFGACGAPSRPNAFSHDDFEGKKWSERSIEQMGAAEFMQAALKLGVIAHTNLDTEVVRGGVLLSNKHAHFHTTAHPSIADRQLPSSISCTIVMGAGDHIVTQKDALMWRDEGYVSGEFRMETIAGGHMFMETNFEHLRPILTSTLSAASN